MRSMRQTRSYKCLNHCHPENLRMIQPKPEKDIIKLRTFYARYLKFIRKCICSLHDYMVCCLLLFRHFGIIEWFHESPPAQCFDSPIIHFFTKTRNVFPCFLTKSRNVYVQFLAKIKKIPYGSHFFLRHMELSFPFILHSSSQQYPHPCPPHFQGSHPQYEPEPGLQFL